MNISDKSLQQQGSNTETIMSKADELELRRYFIKALVWASGVAVSITISAGGFLYKQIADQVNELNIYRIEHQEENRKIMVDYSSRFATLESEVSTIKQWQKEMQEIAKLSNSNQQEILRAIQSLNLKEK
jgi:hypothetical protein